MFIKVASEVIEALKAHNVFDCPTYIQTVTSAANTHPAPYVTPEYSAEYQQRAYDPFWLSACLIANTVKEAEGATQLAVFASRIPPELTAIAKSVIRHANDEAKHAKVFLHLLDLTFPEAVLTPQLKSDLEALIPSLPVKMPSASLKLYNKKQVLDELCQINIGEIRTRVNQLILKPVLEAHAPPQNKVKVKNVMSRLLKEEQQHIAYTAEYLEQMAREGQRESFESIYPHRFSRFNARTICELRGETVGL